MYFLYTAQTGIKENTKCKFSRFSDMTLIFTECKDKKYGLNCSTMCGNCRDLRQCHYINGSCLNGCSPGFQGEKYTMGIILFSFQPQHLCPEWYINMPYSYLGYVLIQYFFLKSVHLDFMELDACRNVVHFAKYHVLVIM